MPPDDDIRNAQVPARLGAIERAILELLQADSGPVPRSSVVHALYPSLRSDQSGDERIATGYGSGAARRSLVEATVSRAIASLVRKGLIVSERQRATGRTILRTTRAEAPLPDWESAARDEEDFAAQAASRAKHWRTLAARARQRALQLREDRRLDTTNDERVMDAHMAKRLQGNSHARTARAVAIRQLFSLPRAVLQLMRREGGRARVVTTGS